VTVQLYSGAKVSPLFVERWLSGIMLGSQGPVGTVEVRRGHLQRSFHPYDSFGLPAFGDYPGAVGNGFWYADWTPTSDWEQLDGVRNVRLDQSFDNNGVTSATLLVDNIVLTEETGHAGMLYHVVNNGYYSPLQGYVAPGRPNLGIPETPYFQVLENAQIRVRQGYGVDTLVTTFLGLVDDIETNSVPNQLTITGRDFGGVLVDEECFGWAKEVLIQDPITFASRDMAENRTRVGGGAQASSQEAGFPPVNVTVVDSRTEWVSQDHSAADVTEWVEIHVPAGTYSSIYLSTSYSHLHAYIGVYPKALGSIAGGYYEPKFNGAPIDGASDSYQTDNSGHVVGVGWYDPNSVTVPGDNGGWAYQGEIGSTVGGSGVDVALAGTFEMGDDSVIRVGFRNLQEDGSLYGDGTHVHRCSVIRLAGIMRTVTQDASQGSWIIIDDVTDIIRCCLRWAGFKQWEVEYAGVNLQENQIFDKSNSLMAIINSVTAGIGFNFFIAEPLDDDDDLDIGYPVCRNNRVFENYTGPTASFSDTTLLTDARVTISNADERSIIRARGVDVPNGITLGGQDGDIKRVMYAYEPPWSAKMAGVIKHLTHTDPTYYATVADCQFACYLLALQIALQKYTTILDLPGTPAIGLDTLQDVIARSQGLNTRVYVTNRTSEMQFGDDGYYTTELGGSLVDTPDVAGVVKDFVAGIAALDRNDYRQPTRMRVAFGSNIPPVRS
jgi:hypothetical protein